MSVFQTNFVLTVVLLNNFYIFAKLVNWFFSLHLPLFLYVSMFVFDFFLIYCRDYAALVCTCTEDFGLCICWKKKTKANWVCYVRKNFDALNNWWRTTDAKVKYNKMQNSASSSEVKPMWMHWSMQHLNIYSNCNIITAVDECECVSLQMISLLIQSFCRFTHLFYYFLSSSALQFNRTFFSQ